MKRIASLILFLMLGSILVACGGGGTTASPSPSPAAPAESPAAESPAAESPAAGTVPAAGEGGAASCETTASGVDRLTWWTRVQEADPEWDEVQQIAQAYTERTGTPVQIINVPDADFRSRMSIAAPAGEGPDVFGPVAHDWIGEFAIQRIAAVVPDGAIKDQDDMIGAALAAATLDGNLYGAPQFVESVALIYNRDMVPEPPATWDELVQIATDLTEGDTYGFAFPLLEQYHEGPFLQGFGGYIFEYGEESGFNVEDIGLNNEGSIQALQFLRDAYHNQQPPMPEVVIDRANMHGVVEGMMEAGQVAMTINGPWREIPLQEAGINYGVAPLPTLPNGEPMRPFLGVQVMGASAFSRNQEAAFDLMNFITCTDNVVTYFGGSAKVPVRQSALEAEAIQSNENIAVWNAQAEVGIPMPNIPAMNNVWRPWGDAVDAIVPPNTPDDQIQQLMDTAVEQIRAAIQQTQG
jgi:arabinogalactan oligomer / maltooligosaccharide transport system substrate-binding protein